MLRYPFEKAWVVTQKFGENPGDYARFGMRAHNGVDFGAPEGTLVLAVADGVVVKSEYDDGGYGNHVVIEHGDGYTAVYAHLAQLRVSAHSHVRAGQLIGTVGSTGNSTGPHLHFELRQRGMEDNGYWGAVDPWGLIDWPDAVREGVPAGFVKVSADVLNVRRGPTVTSPMIGQVRQGTLLKVAPGVAAIEDERGRWLAVLVYVAAERDGLRFVEGE